MPYLKIVDQPSNIFQAKSNRRGYLFYDLLGFKAEPTKFSNKSYIVSRDSIYFVESLHPPTNEVRDKTVWRRKTCNTFAENFFVIFKCIFFKPLHSEKHILQKKRAKGSCVTAVLAVSKINISDLYFILQCFCA